MTLCWRAAVCLRTRSPKEKKKTNPRGHDLMVAGVWHSLCAAVVLLAATASGLHGMPAMRTSAARSQPVVMMGRKFENNKLKMAKTALAYAKKASYIGKKVVNAVKSSGEADPSVNLQLAAVMREANALNVPKDVSASAHHLSCSAPVIAIFLEDGIPACARAASAVLGR